MSEEESGESRWGWEGNHREERELGRRWKRGDCSCLLGQPGEPPLSYAFVSPELFCPAERLVLQGLRATASTRIPSTPLSLRQLNKALIFKSSAPRASSRLSQLENLVQRVERETVAPACIHTCACVHPLPPALPSKHTHMLLSWVARKRSRVREFAYKGFKTQFGNLSPHPDHCKLCSAGK